jgi:hypothetical protein
LNARRLFQARLKTKRARTPAGKTWKKIKKILLSGRAASPGYRNDLHLT